MRVAAIQLSSGKRVEENLFRIDGLLNKAAEKGVELVVLPENFAFMGGDDQEKVHVAEEQEDSATLRHLSAQAKKRGMAIVGGSLLLKGENGRLRNSSPVFDEAGRLLATYDKIHLFDMEHCGDSYLESAMIEPGSQAMSADVKGWRVGLSICYDLRFPELYRLHVDSGCNLLCNVAAFTEVTGTAHWEPLLRARAIENQCYMIAAAQHGVHPDGRKTWGHSMIIDPWGEVLEELPEGEGVIIADLSKKRIDQVRRSMPVLHHRKLR